MTQKILYKVISLDKQFWYGTFKTKKEAIAWMKKWCKNPDKQFQISKGKDT